VNRDHLVLGLLQTGCYITDVLGGYGVTYEGALAQADAKASAEHLILVSKDLSVLWLTLLVCPGANVCSCEQFGLIKRQLFPPHRLGLSMLIPTDDALYLFSTPICIMLRVMV
jgi:hypothetical protein